MSFRRSGCHDFSVRNHYRSNASDCTCSPKLAGRILSINCFPPSQKWEKDKERQSKGCPWVWVSLCCLPQSQPQILHLASIIRAVLFISRSTNIGSALFYFFLPSTRFPGLTLKPHCGIEVLWNPTSPIQIFPLPETPISRNTPDQHLITTTPQPQNRSLLAAKQDSVKAEIFHTYKCCSHRTLLGNSPSRLLGGNHEWRSRGVKVLNRSVLWSCVSASSPLFLTLPRWALSITKRRSEEFDSLPSLWQDFPFCLDFNLCLKKNMGHMTANWGSY